MAKDNGASAHKKLPRKEFDKELQRLQRELVLMQEYVKAEGLKIVVIFEGRDAAGKGGVIKRIAERTNPRTCPPRGRSSCSTGPGTTAPASSA